jgi:hypothetical protein
MSIIEEEYDSPPAKPTGFFRRTLERLHIVETRPQSLVVEPRIFSRGETPELVTFDKLFDYHDFTPQVQIARASYSDLITGTKIQINSDDEDAKITLEEWNRKNNFFEKFRGLVDTTLICGNGLLEKLDEFTLEDVAEVNMRSIISKKRDTVGNVQYYEQQLEGGTVSKIGEGRQEQFIEFNLTNYGRMAWGRSLFYSLAVPRTIGTGQSARRTRPLIEQLWAMEDAMTAIINNHAYPLVSLTYEGANKEQLEKEAEKIRKFKAGDKWVQSRKPEIDIFETQGNSKYTDYVEHIRKAIELGVQFPSDIMTGDFTSRASSETTENIVLKRVRAFQNYMATKLQRELYEPLLMLAGFDDMTKVNLSISFETQNVIELLPQEVLLRVQGGLWTHEEGREWDKDNLGADLFDDANAKQQALDRAKLQSSGGNNLTQDPKTQGRDMEQEEKLKRTIETYANEAIRKHMQWLEMETKRKKSQAYDAYIEKIKRNG